MLKEEQAVEVDLPELVQLIGRKGLSDCTQSVNSGIVENAISFEQIAALWNDL